MNRMAMRYDYYTVIFSFVVSSTNELAFEEPETEGDKQLAGRLTDYDYLVTMQLIKLSMEEKDKLLKDRDDKNK